MQKKNKCPVCRKSAGFYKWPSALNPKKVDILPMPLLQRSYPGYPEYISPRCLRCYEKAEKELFEKIAAAPPIFCRNCRQPLGLTEGLSPYGELTELAFHVCIPCLVMTESWVEDRLQLDPDLDNVISVDGAPLGLHCDKVLLIGMKKRSKQSLTARIVGRFRKPPQKPLS